MTPNPHERIVRVEKLVAIAHRTSRSEKLIGRRMLRGGRAMVGESLPPGPSPNGLGHTPFKRGFAPQRPKELGHRPAGR